MVQVQIVLPSFEKGVHSNRRDFAPSEEQILVLSVDSVSERLVQECKEEVSNIVSLGENGVTMCTY